MLDVLIAYASTHGHTRKIAEHVADGARRAGHAPRLADLESGDVPDPAVFDIVVAAASLHAGKHQSAAVTWLRDHNTTLSERPSALLSVSMTAAEATDEARATTRRIIDELLTETGWTPTIAVPVAGALQWDKYNLPTRIMMRLITRKHGAPPDRPATVVYTDWDALDATVSRLLASSVEAMGVAVR